LHFHHLRDKKDQISRMAATVPLERLKAEVEKCIVLCANCHAIVHRENGDSGRSTPRLDTITTDTPQLTMDAELFGIVF